jgi:hypothetical protein
MQATDVIKRTPIDRSAGERGIDRKNRSKEGLFIVSRLLRALIILIQIFVLSTLCSCMKLKIYSRSFFLLLELKDFITPSYSLSGLNCL